MRHQTQLLGSFHQLPYRKHTFFLIGDFFLRLESTAMGDVMTFSHILVFLFCSNPIPNTFKYPPPCLLPAPGSFLFSLYISLSFYFHATCIPLPSSFPVPLMAFSFLEPMSSFVTYKYTHINNMHMYTYIHTY